MNNKITFRLYQIDRSLPGDMIEGYLSLETTDDLDPQIYRCVWESQEDYDLDALYDKYSNIICSDKKVYRGFFNVSDVVEIELENSSIFYICDNFGWAEIEFDKTQVPV